MSSYRNTLTGCLTLCFVALFCPLSCVFIILSLTHTGSLQWTLVHEQEQPLHHQQHSCCRGNYLSDQHHRERGKYWNGPFSYIILFKWGKKVFSWKRLNVADVGGMILSIWFSSFLQEKDDSSWLLFCLDNTLSNKNVCTIDN